MQIQHSSVRRYDCCRWPRPVTYRLKDGENQALGHGYYSHTAATSRFVRQFRRNTRICWRNLLGESRVESRQGQGIFRLSKMFRRWSGAQTASHSVGTRCSSFRAKRARREVYNQRINIHVVLYQTVMQLLVLDSTWWGMSPHSWALQMTSAVFMHYSGNIATSAINSAGCPTTMTVLISRNPMLTASFPHFVDAAWLTYQLPTQAHCADPRNCSSFIQHKVSVSRSKGIATKSNFEKIHPIQILSP